jgi:hypothetical protein
MGVRYHFALPKNNSSHRTRREIADRRSELLVRLSE